MPAANISEVTLKNGSAAELWKVTAPATDWQPELRRFLNNPPEPGAPSLHEFLLAHDLPGLNVNYFTMKSGDEIIGCIITTDGGTSSYINSTFVPREHRQLGIARSLMDALENDFEDRGGRVRFLTTRTGSPAEVMFLKVGYQVKWEGNGRTGMEKLYSDTTWESYFDIPEAELSIRNVAWGDWNPHRTMTWRRDNGGYHPMDGNFIGLMRDSLNLRRAVWKGLFSPDGRMVGGAVVRTKDSWSEADVGTSVVDLYVHPNFEASADELLEEALPASGSLQTFLIGASADTIKRFEALGFAFETSLKDDYNHHNPSTPDIRVYSRG